MVFPLLLAAAGIAAIGYGTVEQTKAAKKTAEANQQIAGQERASEAARQKAMELDARRRQREVIRNQQRARALSLATTTSQGASAKGSSALGGAYGQIAGETGTNLTGINQNLLLGRDIFSANQNISNFRSQIAGYQSDAAFGAGISSLGGALVGNLGTISAIGKGFGGMGSSGGNNQGYGTFVSGLGRGAIY